MYEEMLPKRRWDKSVLFLISNQEPVKKKCLHAIRRGEGKHFKVTENTKICSQHFRKGDIRNVSRDTLKNVSRKIPMPLLYWLSKLGRFNGCFWVSWSFPTGGQKLQQHRVWLHWGQTTVKFPHSPILHYAFSSWIEKTMNKTIHSHWENRFVLQ